ncbi:MAG: U32 family peptidase [Tannerella sp.]|jgi:putative protease|nr:U32 family peptidase [Tannerella sp.]
MQKSHQIELLSPARNLECGLEAVRHGADAVYIGAPRFSARAAAGNTVDDIRSLCNYAHIYNVKVYVALNTLLKEDERSYAVDIAWQMYDVGVDALIIQDINLLECDIPPIPLHASTQMDNRTKEHVRRLHDGGFDKIVLARELTLNEIRSIHEYVPQAALEVFIHGALCVCYSGRCYLSEYMTGRSANRGECAQCCRLPYTLTDNDGRVLASNKHLLSLRDLNRTADLEALIMAGVRSFKIEGRLKDVSYVKNITAWYRQRLDRIITSNAGLCRSSAGRSSYTFEPQPEKSFNRGFTSCFLHGRNVETLHATSLRGRNDVITSFDTPKSIGEAVGKVTGIRGNSFTVDSNVILHNDDGLAFVNSQGESEGIKVNRVETLSLPAHQVGARPALPAFRVFPYKMPHVEIGSVIFRNFDKEFEDVLGKMSAERHLKITIEWGRCIDGFTVSMTDETGISVTVANHGLCSEIARTPQDENIRKQLSKVGNTPFEVEAVTITYDENLFVPSSVIGEMRRRAVELLLSARRMTYQRSIARHSEMGLDLSLNRRSDSEPLMTTKHCLRYSFGLCADADCDSGAVKSPLYLTTRNIRLRLDFDCKNCEMTVRHCEQKS